MNKKFLFWTIVMEHIKSCKDVGVVFLGLSQPLIKDSFFQFYLALSYLSIMDYDKDNDNIYRELFKFVYQVWKIDDTPGENIMLTPLKIIGDKLPQKSELKELLDKICNEMELGDECSDEPVVDNNDEEDEDLDDSPVDECDEEDDNTLVDGDGKGEESVDDASAIDKDQCEKGLDGSLISGISECGECSAKNSNFGNNVSNDNSNGESECNMGAEDDEK